MRKKVLAVVICCFGLFLAWMYYFTAIGHLIALDGLSSVLGKSALEEHTIYAPGYSHAAFRMLRVGMDWGEVTTLLGQPLREVWEYENRALCGRQLLFEDNKLSDALGNPSRPPRPGGVKVGMTRQEVTELCGEPSSVSLSYSTTPGDQGIRLRAVWLKGNRVTSILSELYFE